jgi:SnoaL-like protein
MSSSGSHHMGTYEQRIREVCDKDEIRDLARFYAQFIIEERGDLIPPLFTEDGRVDFGAEGGPIIGRVALTKFFSVSKETFGLISNHAVMIDGDGATGRCAMHSPWSQNKSPGVAGCYRDEYRRVSGRWLFFSRQFKIFHGPAEQKALFQPLW